MSQRILIQMNEKANGTAPRRGWRGPQGGAANEAGGAHRAGVATYFVAHGLAGKAIAALELQEKDGIPVSIAVEADAFVDDLVTTLSCGGRVFTQAKLSTAFGESPASSFATEVLPQWIAQLRTGLDPSRDRLTLALDRAAKPLADLRRALVQRRKVRRGETTPVMTSETEALRVLEAHLARAKLSREEQEALLDAAVILELCVSVPGQRDALASEQLLEGIVIREGRGREAVTLLCAKIRELGAARGELSVTGFREVLSSSGIPILETQRRQARELHEASRKAFQRYLDRVRQEGSELDLRGFGADVSQMPIERPCSGLLVRPCEENSSDHVPLAVAMKRRGRMLLLGAPGAGKSTALRQLGALGASQTGWPTPMVVRLDALAAAVPIRNIVDAILDLSVERLPSVDKVLVREELARRLGIGRVVVLLDGLDECREKTPHVVKALDEFIRYAHEDMEIVISTRDVGFAAAASLGLPEIELVTPSDLHERMQDLAAHLAWEEGLVSADADLWAAERMSWIDRLAAEDPVLSNTPLLPVLLLLLSRTKSLVELPSERARVLAQVVDEVVIRAEISARRHGDFELGVLRNESATAAVLSSFNTIAHEAGRTEPLSVSTAQNRVAEDMRDAFVLTRPQAEAAAKEAVRFWDEAGIFLIQRSGLELRPRLNLMAEIGDARFAANLHDPSPWLVDSYSKSNVETLRLAVGLDPRIADALTSLAADDRELWALEACVTAREQGASFGPEALDKLASALREIIRAVPEEAWEATKILTKLPIPPGNRSEIVEEIAQAVPATHAAYARALMAVEWKLDLAWCEPVLETILGLEHPPRVKHEGPATLELLAIDEGYSRALAGAGLRLLPTRPDLASLVIDAIGNCRRDDGDRLREALLHHGHQAAVTEHEAQELAKISDSIRPFLGLAKTWEKLMNLIEELGTASTPSWRESRRADELADFISTLDIADSPGFWVDTALQRDLDGLRRCLFWVMRLGHFDPDLLSAEAAMLGSEEELRSTTLLFDHRHARDLDGWENLSAEERATAIEELAAMMPSHPWFRRIAYFALARCNDAAACVSALEPVLESKIPEVREDVGLVISFHDSGNATRLRAWQLSSDSRLRVVAARVVSLGWQSDEWVTYEDILRSALDDDRGVRRAVLRILDKRPELSALGDLHRRMEETPATGWQCAVCGHENTLDSESCAECHRVAP